MARVIILASGGIDSTVLLAFARKYEHEVIAFFVDYGQRSANMEWQAVQKLAVGVYGAEPVRVEADPKTFESSILIGHWNDPIDHDFSGDPVELAGRENNPLDVPFRNGVLISLAVSVAVQRKFSEVWIGTHRSGLEKQGLSPFYPDCSPEFLSAMRIAIRYATCQTVTLSSPLQTSFKEDVIKLGNELSVPWSKTYSCYVGRRVPCGKCLQCQDRNKFLEVANVP
jgi:7-cyano-7-deazaguanine synthase